MATIGFLHSGHPHDGQKAIQELSDFLKAKSKKPANVRLPDWREGSFARARSLMDVDVLWVPGGSRPADAAIQARGSAKTPIIVYTTVAPYIVRKSDPAMTTGVCAHTSDNDGTRLELLLDMLQYQSPTIGLLWNSNRGDTADQWKQIHDAAAGRCSLFPKNINNNVTIKQAFAAFEKHGIDGLLVAADHFFYGNLQEVLDKARNYPAIYQWREFVHSGGGGLMSFGSNRSDCYARARDMLIQINETGKVPPIYEAPPELVVSQTRAEDDFHRWPLPTPIQNYNPKPVIVP
jgi:hypothetical protein